MVITFCKMIEMKRFFLIISVFAGIAASAQTKPMTMKECMEYALEHSSDIEIQRADNSDSRIDRRDAILAAFAPEISAGTAVKYSMGRTPDPNTNIYYKNNTFGNGYSADASIYLFNGFEAINNIKIAKTAVAMGISSEQQTSDKICLAVMEAYTNVVYYTFLTDNLGEQVETAKSAVLRAERQEELGQKGHADVVQLRADLADREYQYVTTDNKRKDAMITLQSLMLWPVDEELIIDTSLSDSEQTLTDPTVKDDIISCALNNNPSALIAKGKLDIARKRLNTAKWQLLPSLSLSAGWDTNYSFAVPKPENTPSFPYMFRNNMGGNVQLTMLLPIDTRLSRLSRISKSRNEVRKAQATYDKTLKDIEAEVMRAINDRDGAARAYLLAERRAETQEESFMLNTRKMEQGLISPIEFRTASDNYINAKAEKIGSQLKLRLAECVVRYYKGISYIDQL